MSEIIRVGCVLMAAGSGTRFGENKLLAVFDGVSLIRRAMEAVPASLHPNTVVVTQYEEIEALAQAYGFACVRNLHPEWGVSHTVKLGTEALAARCDGILYLVADQPLLRRETVESLVEAFRASPAFVFGLSADGVRGNPCVFPKALFPELCRLEGDRGGSQVIRRHPSLLRLLAAPARELADVDTAATLRALEENRESLS